MKIRVGYVTNSSSSSYVCIVCGEVESGMDMSISEAGMVGCENGHTFCEHHLLDPVRQISPRERLERNLLKKIENYEEAIKNNPRGTATYKEWIKETKEELEEILRLSEEEVEEKIEEYREDDEYNIPTERCPICQMETLKDNDIAAYLMKKFNVNLNDLKKELKETFNTYRDFEKSLK